LGINMESIYWRNGIIINLIFMLKKYFKILIFTFLLFFVANNVFAGRLLDPTKINPGFMAGESAKVAGINVGSDNDIGGVVSLVIKAFLSILALLFIVLVILGGYYWMSAGGDETKMTKAKDTIQKAIIGLIIIISAYTITVFIFKALEENKLNIPTSRIDLVTKIYI